MDYTPKWLKDLLTQLGAIKFNLPIAEKIHIPEPEYYKDPLTLKRIETIHPVLREELREIYNEICTRLNGKVICRFSWVLRTYKQQDDIYAKGRTLKGRIVTWARGGFSFHNFGLAVDIVLLIDKDGNGFYEEASWDTKADYDQDNISDWMEIVEVFKDYGWTWGGEWARPKTDAPHFQKPLGNSTKKLRTLPKQNGYPVL